MRFRPARLLFLLAVISLIAVAVVFFWRARSTAAYGPAVALCPGPDGYGYTCEGAAAYAYIDATTPTNLFADDAVARLDLPFPFTFYGAEHTSVTAASNGNLQFTTSSPLAYASCLAPAAGMGDLISPYWADLDLTLFGQLETQVAGEAPNRVFVVEWDDVPLYGGDPADRVTFEAQLFEGSNDIVFLYEDPTTVAGGAGGRAVVGLQSEGRGLSLSFSCLQPVLPTAGGLRFAHPPQPNRDAAEAVTTARPALQTNAPAAKGPVAELLARYASDGPAALDGLRLSWLGAQPPRAFAWRAADLTGDGRDELLAVWRGPAGRPEMAQVAVLAVGDGQLTPLLDRPLSERDAAYSEVVIEELADLTGDGRIDAVLRDRPSGRAWALAAIDGAVTLFDVPEACRGGLIIQNDPGDGRPTLIRDGCPTPGRLAVVWDGAGFVHVP
ncbi:protein of unknown function [Candidatus Promineifilum breve]|uniref:VCBS repeat-containing protein n=1 Tax=Candidatus Promineifilum breve TaxID=1806508 RepID=A0A160T6T7_9CHLR|nr:hypothetical protein [Candidatus Promineifilum breve]CUS04755.2 protein of unknown function [Candidatus Promineifilum breve]